VSLHGITPWFAPPPPDDEFVGITDYISESFHDILVGESEKVSDSNSSMGSHHPSLECFMADSPEGRVESAHDGNTPPDISDDEARERNRAPPCVRLDQLQEREKELEGARPQGTTLRILRKRNLGRCQDSLPQVQKLLYAVLIAKRKLRHYFKSHSVMVVTSFPLGEILRNPDATGRIVKWALELMGQGISYAPITAIKSQVLADFIAEWIETQMPPATVNEEYWTMYFDGSPVKEGAGLGFIFVSPLGVRMRYVVCVHFPASNNVAEYEALINGLRIASSWAYNDLRPELTRDVLLI
jgi:hypothetical protein